MTKDRLLTARWNNRLSLGLGLPALAFAVFALATAVLSPLTEFIALAAVGVVF